MSEGDAAMTPAVQTRVFEVHPELSFHEMTGGKAMAYGKKKRAGRQERATALAAAGMLRAGAKIPKVLGAAPDDVLDALVACWTARRIHLKHAVRMPDRPPVDARGLRMEIWR
jgi:predicted RNase H-like nuclease